jgi:hypothetical protein
MLFIETRTAELNIERRLRTPMLEALRERGHLPLIRAARLHFFEQATSNAERASELEHALEERADNEGEEPYVHGDVFCSEDFAHFIIFGDGATLRAGIIYNADTHDPLSKLEAFCGDVREAFENAARESGGALEPTVEDFAGADSTAHFSSSAARIEWRAPDGHTSETLGRSNEADASREEARHVAITPERAHAVEIFEDAAARGFLQRLSEAHTDRRVVEMVATGRGPEQESLIATLAGAGLVRREVQVSCRKDGRSLFRLPSPEALAIVTASNAVCSECGSAVADERAEELVTPTQLASSMLKDGAWLVSSLRSILDGLGVPESETTTRPRVAEGEAQVVANVCGEPFLFVLRDGDFTTAHARHAVEGETEAQASRMVVVASGKVQDEARARLREHARRRSRAGSETEVIFVEGFERAADELRPFIVRVSEDALTRELYELDADAGFNVGYALAARFRLTQHHDSALQDLAASAAGALAGSL